MSTTEVVSRQGNLRGRSLVLAALFVIVTVTGFSAALATSPDPVVGTATSNSAGIGVTTRGSYLSCQSGSLDFTLDPGRLTAAGISIGTIDNSTWGDCIASFGVQMDVQQSGEWAVEALSGLVGGTGTFLLKDISANVSDTGGGLCSFEVTGLATALIDLDSHEISVASNGSEIIASNIEGCVGAISEGDPIVVNATFEIP